MFCIYFQEKIFPKGSFQPKSFVSSLLNQNPNDIGKNNNGQFIDLSLVPLDKLNQIILENGIFEHIPLYVIESEHHSKFIGQFMMLAYELAKNTSISREDFLQALSKLAIRLFSIPPSEAGAERKLSKLKWRFPDRRNRISEETLMNEIYVEETFMQKLNSNKEFSKAIWELPPHNNS